MTKIRRRSAARLALRMSGAAVSGLCQLALPAYGAGPNAAPAPMQIAQIETRSFNIPAQSLTGAVSLFGQESGYQVSADAAITAGLRSQTVVGTFFAGRSAWPTLGRKWLDVPPRGRRNGSAGTAAGRYWRGGFVGR